MSSRFRADFISSIIILLLLLSSMQRLSASESEQTDSKSSFKEFDTKSALRISQAAIGQRIGDYRLQGRDGQLISLSRYRGKPLVVSMIFTSCFHICPTISQHLAKVVKEAHYLLGAENFNVITIGFDTFNDTPEVMQAFARKQRIDLPGWDFLAADKDTIQELTRDLGFQYHPSPSGFDHLMQTSVVDPQGIVYRQIYGMNFHKPLLVDPLKELVLGQPIKGTLLTSISNRIRLFCTVYDPASDRYHVDYSLFVGIVIGIIILGGLCFWLVHEWRHNNSRAGGT